MRILRFLTGGGVALVACLIALELFLRLSGTSIPSFVQDDARFGRVLRPDTPLLFVNEGFYLGDVNHYGYLGPGRPPEKTAGTVRIALLGDSFVEGFQLLDRQHLRSRLERGLNETGDAPVEVLNFGFSGFNFPRMYHYWSELVADYDPDLVLFFVGVDDFQQPSTDLGPRFRTEGDSLVVDLGFRDTRSFRRKTQFSATRHFGFYTLFKKAYQLVRQGRTAAIVLDKLHPAHGAPAAEIDWAGESVNPAMDRVNERMLAALGEANASGDVRIAFVVKRDLGDHYPELLSRNGLRLLDPEPALDVLRAQGIDPHWWPATSRRGHWNADAHAAIAGFLEPEVRRLIEASEPN
ncbi:MAG: hypothetical protein DHS20C21_14840 [Gemmatimonadota bacterium]|nr:MAG: hypothetical protein DHS20C21_14840 [Gemmatimonadota bacterium]